MAHLSHRDSFQTTHTSVSPLSVSEVVSHKALATMIYSQVWTTVLALPRVGKRSFLRSLLFSFLFFFHLFFCFSR